MADTLTTEQSSTERAQRMYQALLGSAKRGAKLELNVEITTSGGQQYQQTFRVKAWDGRGGRMVSLDLGDGSWSEGTQATKVLHHSVAAGTCYPAKGMRDEAMLYAARAALRYAQGTPVQPSNGTVEVREASCCGCCGRRLTHPVSLDLGVGPECAQECGLEHHYRGTTLKARSAKRTKAEAARDRVMAAENAQELLVGVGSHGEDDPRYSIPY